MFDLYHVIRLSHELRAKHCRSGLMWSGGKQEHAGKAGDEGFD